MERLYQSAARLPKPSQRRVVPKDQDSAAAVRSTRAAAVGRRDTLDRSGGAAQRLGEPFTPVEDFFANHDLFDYAGTLGDHQLFDHFDELVAGVGERGHLGLGGFTIGGPALDLYLFFRERHVLLDTVFDHARVDADAAVVALAN